ncbi:MAG: hypothetical protein ISS47_05055 [Candidatus Omnitrophica bacterium]|nr:hypothetical protein [Candidatus Omnitrophota bacterium]
MKIFIFLMILFYCIPASASQLADYNKVKCIIHIHTDISSGRRALESYVKKAIEKGIDVIVVTDDDWRRWEYGLPPFRRLIKKVVQKKSVMTFGIEKYLNLIQDIDERYKDIVIIDGVQTNPFYFWSGNFLKGTLALGNRNKDMLVIGLGDAESYRNMPLVTNYRSRFDAYHDDEFTRPYQDLIDYVIKKRGLIFWSHPEFEENTLIDGIRLITVPYPGDLIGTRDYTGFGIFWEGYHKVGKPLGIWDRILTEYCQGRRKSPIWAMGELEDEGDKDLDDIVNIVYVKSLNRQQILDALKKGRFCVTFNLFDRVPLVLEEFTVNDEKGTKTATMAEEISFFGDPIIKIHILHEQSNDKNIIVKLIRNNEIIEEFRSKSQIEIEYKDEELLNNQKYYYRIDVINGDSSYLISNPVFFKKIPKNEG